jgi:hypothetical protein
MEAEEEQAKKEAEEEQAKKEKVEKAKGKAEVEKEEVEVEKEEEKEEVENEKEKVEVEKEEEVVEVEKEGEEVEVEKAEVEKEKKVELEEEGVEKEKEEEVEKGKEEVDDISEDFIRNAILFGDGDDEDGDAGGDAEGDAEGTKEQGTAEEQPLEPVPQGETAEQSEQQSKHQSEVPKWGVGQKVMVNYGGDGDYFEGTVKQARGDGTYDVVYDDGDEEEGVSANLIRATNETQAALLPSEAPVQWSEGQKVKANYGGEGEYFGGVIMRCREDGTYDVRYDDGDGEEGVGADMIQAEAQPEGS